MARVVLARRARAQLRELGWPLFDAVEDAIGVLGRDPLAGEPLRGRLRGLRSLRIGAYRILSHLREDGRTVRIAAIEHRDVAYRRDPR